MKTPPPPAPAPAPAPRRASDPCSDPPPPPPPPSDAQLLADVLAGRARAWEPFLVRVEPVVKRAIHRVALQFPGRMGREDREDVRASLVASLFARDCGRLRAYDPARGASVAGWIALLAEHAAYDFLRARRTDERARGCAARTWRDHEVGRRAIEELLDEKRRVAALTLAAGTLPPRQRELYELHFERGLDAALCARAMNTSLQTVHSCRHKLEQHLSRALRRQGRGAGVAA